MQIVKLDRVTSTQDFAEAVSEMIDGDFVVVAKEQTKARGDMAGMVLPEGRALGNLRCQEL